MQTQSFELDYDIFEPFEKLIGIELKGKTVEVPENNSLLRCLQYLHNEGISYGDFCWNGDCTHCVVRYSPECNSAERNGLACRIHATEGMKISLVSEYIQVCLK
ncbi:MAG TPA: 2Fe-2S iron-sulfur cluster-binding protein [Blastocatellia bacterium]|nr:2Fe-2S iron-sulfur cluster-binding protein [Blastocatellia bacterium]